MPSKNLSRKSWKIFLITSVVVTILKSLGGLLLGIIKKIPLTNNKLE